MVFMYGERIGKKVQSSHANKLFDRMYYLSTSTDVFYIHIETTAKCMTECYDYLFEIAVKMKSIGQDPAAVPSNSEYKDLVVSQ